MAIKLVGNINLMWFYFGIDSGSIDLLTLLLSIRMYPFIKRTPNMDHQFVSQYNEGSEIRSPFFFFHSFIHSVDGWVDEVGNKLLKFKLIRIDWNCGWFVLHQSHKVTHFAPICARWYVGSNASGLPDEEREQERWKICHYFQARSICLHAIRNRDQIICISQRNTWRRLISHSFVNCFSFSSLLLLCGSVCQLFCVLDSLLNWICQIILLRT